MSRPNTVLKVPTLPRGDVIASYTSYLEAQKAVDYLADSKFAVEYVTIVGTDLKMVERVIGRLTTGRVAAAGLASGAWFGLFVGLLLTLFGSASGGAVGGVLITAIVLGAGFGMLFSVLTFALSGRKRDFTSSSQIVASEYSILCAPERSGEARTVLGRLAAGVPATESAAPGIPPVPPLPPTQGPGAWPGQNVPPQQGTTPPWPTPTPAPGQEPPAAPKPTRAPDPRFVTPGGAPRYGAMLSDFETTSDAAPADAAPAQPPAPAQPANAEPAAPAVPVTDAAPTDGVPTSDAPEVAAPAADAPEDVKPADTDERQRD